jgi:hypothetical protein
MVEITFMTFTEMVSLSNIAAPHTQQQNMTIVNRTLPDDHGLERLLLSGLRNQSTVWLAMFVRSNFSLTGMIC